MYQVTKSKTSIYIDKDLWQRFRLRANRRGLQVSGALESLMEEEMIEDMIERKLSEMVDSETREIDFPPIKTKASVSELVRVMRDERTSGLLRQ